MSFVRDNWKVMLWTFVVLVVLLALLLFFGDDSVPNTVYPVH